MHTSPIVRFALEVYQHALESASSGNPRDQKLAVLHFAQAIELAVKAALVERNHSIYEKDGRTIGHHKGLADLAKAWGLEKLKGQARIELLIDERNAIQHRYGSIDEVTLNYHMQTTFDTLSDILQQDFETSLSDWMSDSLDRGVWEKVKFVTGSIAQQPSQEIIPQRSENTDLIAGFVSFEGLIKSRLIEAKLSLPDRFSTLDVAMKVVANSPELDVELLKEIPASYKLRNRVIHGDHVASEAEVRHALEVLDDAIRCIFSAGDDLLKRALEASIKGQKGTNLTPWPTEAELAALFDEKATT